MKGTVLVIDDTPIVRDPIAATLEAAGYQALRAGNGQQALEALRSQKVDLILLDVQMPVMDGLTFLRVLRGASSTAQIPVLMLSGAEDRKDIVQAAKFGILGYILKSNFSLKDLLTRVAQHFSSLVPMIAPIIPLQQPSDSPQAIPKSAVASPAREIGALASAAPESKVPNPNEVLAQSMDVPILLTREGCLDRVKKALQGKALSGVAAQVIQLATAPGSDAAQLGESISHDPILSVKVLCVANSTAYATSRGQVTTVFEAIKKIGFSAVRNIAATVGIIEAMPAGRGRDGFDPIRSWQHSFAVAMLTERLVSSGHNANQSDAAIGYLAGLCHDLGEILFQTCFGDECRQIQKAHDRTGHPVAELEKVMLGMPASELIGLTLRTLSLPDAIRGPIEAMHGPTPTNDPMGSILCFADIYANGMLLAASSQSPLRGFTASECERALAKKAAPNLDRGKIRREIFALTMLLSQMNDPNLTAPLFPSTKSPIWLAREADLSKMDPVEVALESLAQVQSNNRLPTPDEAMNFKALVIEATDASTGPFASQNIAAFKNSCKTELPILWLVHQCEMSLGSSDQQSQPVVMPTTLEVLAKFVAAA